MVLKKGYTALSFFVKKGNQFIYDSKKNPYLSDCVSHSKAPLRASIGMYKYVHHVKSEYLFCQIRYVLSILILY